MTQDHKEAQDHKHAVTIYVEWILSTPAHSAERKHRVKPQVMVTFIAGVKHGLKFSEIEYEENAPIEVIDLGHFPKLP